MKLEHTPSRFCYPRQQLNVTKTYPLNLPFRCSSEAHFFFFLFFSPWMAITFDDRRAPLLSLTFQIPSSMERRYTLSCSLLSIIHYSLYFPTPGITILQSQIMCITTLFTSKKSTGLPQVVQFSYNAQHAFFCELQSVYEHQHKRNPSANQFVSTDIILLFVF